jgi:lactate dehydrogenase-like 2-hydroxyacid dehydrogenase
MLENGVWISLAHHWPEGVVELTYRHLTRVGRSYWYIGLERQSPSLHISPNLVLNTTTMAHHIVGLEELHVSYPSFSVPITSHHYTSTSELHERVKDATIIITTTVKLDAETLSPEYTPRLQHVAAMAAGTDHVDLEACRKRGITVSNCPHAASEVVSDHAIGLYFAARRKTVMMHTKTLAVPSEWKAKGSVATYLKDSKGGAPLSAQDEVCGIVGYGALGM